MKTLVTYFSASGRTRKTAEKIAEYLKADLHEIKPEVPYQKKDLNWLNPLSRSSKEMKDPSSRPVIIKEELDIQSYDQIVIGFPIWWYIAPTIINTFLESYNFENKKVILFATSGSSDFGKTKEKLEVSLPSSASLSEGQVFSGLIKDEKIKEWTKTL